MQNIDQQLEELFNLTPAEKETAVAIIEEPALPALADEQLMQREDLKSDIDFVRDKMRKAVELGAEAMEDLLALSKTSQGFEHYTALASLIKSLNETNRNILDLHKGVIEIENTAPKEAEVTTATNNNIIGNAEMIIDMIQKSLGVGRGLEAAAQSIVLDANAPGLQ